MTPRSPSARGAEVERLDALSALTARLGRCTDLDALLTVALDSLHELFGFDHSMLLMLDETGTSLYTIGSHGYESAGIGSRPSEPPAQQCSCVLGGRLNGRPPRR